MCLQPRRLTNMKGYGIMKKRFVSNKALNHSSKGNFFYSKTGKRQLIMKSGGHGQENISFLTKRNMSHDIDTVFSNGVRLGHISPHRLRRDRKKNGHAWFPKHWKKREIKAAGRYVASLKRNKPLIDDKRYTGRYKGVTVGIIAKNNRIKTIFPAFDVNKHARNKATVIFSK